ncbi:DUF2254 family protein, partial [Marinobacter sp.]|uniref:DUF2254 family protein n=1 Tax=Marinobacter sp. TaxID=50741 RepID=UPI0034A44278
AVALKARREAPTLLAAPVTASAFEGQALPVDTPGYVQEIHVQNLQVWAEEAGARVRVAALPGTFLAPGDPLAWVRFDNPPNTEDWRASVASCFAIGPDRVFDQDPRFGFVVLSEIAVRALSPAVNDPGTANKVIQTMIRLLDLWHRTPPASPATIECDRIEVPELSIQGLFDDAFTSIGRDGAGMVEVAVMLQQGLFSLGRMGARDIAEAADHHARMALSRSERALTLPDDLTAVRQAANRQH